jgi:tetratricopeptide (TPR) repeat protein
MTPSPSHPGPLFERCATWLRQGDKRASALLPQLEPFRDYAPGWLQIGEALLAAQQHPAALVAFGRAAFAKPGWPPALLGQAACLRAAGRPAEAQTALRRATAAAPGFAPAWFSLGLACQDLQDAPGAIAAYRAALAADPALHEAAFNLGVALQDSGALEPALDAYRLALQSRPEALGRIAHALSSAATGCLWLSLEALRDALLARGAGAGAELLAVESRPGQ